MLVDELHGLVGIISGAVGCVFCAIFVISAIANLAAPKASAQATPPDSSASIDACVDRSTRHGHGFRKRTVTCTNE